MSYDTEVLADAPALYWRLQDTSGTTATDASGNARNGTIAGIANTDYKLNQPGLIASEPAAGSFLFAYYTPAGADNKGWYGLITGGTTPGSRAYISRNYEAWMNWTGTWTAEFWIKFALGNMNNATIMGRRATTLQWQIACTANGLSASAWHASAGASDYYPTFGTAGQYLLAPSPDFPNSLIMESSFGSNLNLYDNKPHHVVARRNGTTGLIEIFVDGIRGQIAATLPDNAQTSASDPLVVGSYANVGNNGVVAYLQKVALYTTLLPADRIQAHYLAGSQKIAALHLGYALDAYVGGGPPADVTNLSDVAQYFYSAGASAQNEVSMSDAASTFLAMGNSVTDGLSTSDATGGGMAFGPVITDTVSTSDSDSGIKQLVESITDSLSAADTQTAATVQIAVASDGVTMYCGLQHGQETYVGYVLNAENNASSFYEGFDFNSMAKIGNDYFGANQDGIFKLEGDTDAGDQISAMANVGTSDAATAKQKAYDSIYIGLTAGGKMMLKVIVDGTEYFYEATDAAANMKEVRVVPGRGLQATFWQFELWNQAGADFDIASIEFHPVVLTRRI